jgi:hypothetical protein
MTKNRTPIRRSSRFTPEAVDAFRLMRLLRVGSDEWYHYHNTIFFLVGKPWLFPVVEPDETSGICSDPPHPEAVQNYKELERMCCDSQGNRTRRP